MFQSGLIVNLGRFRGLTGCDGTMKTVGYIPFPYYYAVTNFNCGADLIMEKKKKKKEVGDFVGSYA